MCLLVVCSRTEPDAPLLVAANRDERYGRPARPAGLWPGPLRILAGRDEEAGGTWLAVNEAGVVAGLTNQPSGEGRDPGKRSRGELPLLAARHSRADVAAEALASEVDASAYNPCALLVGDRSSLFAVALDAGAKAPSVRELGPGRYVLENRPFGTVTPKTAFVRHGLDALTPDETTEGRLGILKRLLADHTVPEGAAGDPRRPAVLAACVHTADYGTRSATLVVVGQRPPAPPVVLAAEGPPCVSPFHELVWA